MKILTVDKEVGTEKSEEGNMWKLIILVFATIIAFCILCLIGATIVKAATPVVEISDLKIDDLVVRGFELSKRSEVEILAVGSGAKYSKFLYAYGWIISAEDREVVWSMLDDCYDAVRQSDALVECEETIRLRPGKYEVYYFVGSHAKLLGGELGVEVNDLGDLIELFGDLFNGEKSERGVFNEEDTEELIFTIKTEKSAKSYTPVFGEPQGSVVYINQPERDEFHQQGFTLKQAMDLEVYAIGEFSDSYEVFVDGAWIINAENRKQVWTMDKWNTDRAGGAGKNRYFRDIIALPAGNYIACYATDDSHDPGGWNSPPPSDPFNYGITIAAANSADAKNVAAYDDEMNMTKIVAIDRVRDNAFEKAAFTLKKDSRIHIIGLGERDYSNDFLVDYGWIVNAEDLTRIWEMTADNTGHGGGAAKNARFDGIIELPAGDYIVYYRTDDSHAYGSWNMAPPFEKRMWGITLYGVAPDFDESSFTLLDELHPLGNSLVDMTGLGDNVAVSRSFNLKETTKVRIMALGEGKGKTMYDYGWIEDNETGEVIWEMTYRKTHHAGGATKNRMVVANLILEKGTYTAHFVTDDSHSLERFNSSPPDNPEQWGMIILKK